MKNSKLLFSLFACLSILSLLLLVTACASNKSQLNAEIDAQGQPKWVTRGTSTIRTAAGRYFRGVAYAKTGGDFSRQTSIADNRARAELERIVSSYIEIVSRDFMASESTLLAPINHQQIMRNIEAITKQNMQGVRVDSHWQDMDADKVYAIAIIDMQHMRQRLERTPNLEPVFLDYFRTEGSKIFDRISSRSY